MDRGKREDRGEAKKTVKIQCRKARSKKYNGNAEYSTKNRKLKEGKGKTGNHQRNSLSEESKENEKRDEKGFQVIGETPKKYLKAVKN